MVQRAPAHREAAGELPWVCNCSVIGHSTVSILLEEKNLEESYFGSKPVPMLI